MVFRRVFMLSTMQWLSSKSIKGISFTIFMDEMPFLDSGSSPNDDGVSMKSKGIFLLRE